MHSWHEHLLLCLTGCVICWICWSCLLCWMPTHPRSPVCMQAGQLLLFLRHTLHVPDQQVLQDCFKWAAALAPQVTQVSMAAVAESLQQQLGLSEQQLLPLLQQFPEVLAWDVQQDLLPKLEFFNALGPAGRQLLAGTLYDPESGYMPVSPPPSSAHQSTQHKDIIPAALQHLVPVPSSHGMPSTLILPDLGHPLTHINSRARTCCCVGLAQLAL